MNSKVLSVYVLVAVAAVSADHRPSYGYGSPDFSAESLESFESFESREAKYDFNWAVRDSSSGNDFGHQESRDGDNTDGSYYVHLPDGRRQTVTYYVDGDSGYIADVKYSGEARYPDSYESASFESASFEHVASPSFYGPPRPSYG